MENNPYILVFKHKVINQLKNKNFTNEQRLPFYQELSKIARNLVNTLTNENDKNDVLNYVKRFIVNMSQNNTLTPQQALQSFQNDIDKQPKIKIKKEKSTTKKTYNSHTSTDLFDAISDGNIQEVDNYIQSGSNLDIRDEHDDTPLIRATICKKKDIANLLIKNGADIDAEGMNASTALMVALNYRYYQMAEFLIKNGANPNIQDITSETPLMNLAKSEEPTLTQLLIDYGADVNKKSIKYQTALSIALRNNSTKTCEVLINNGADINVEDDTRDTPLMIAATKGNEHIAQILIDKGANINAQNKNGYTPLMFACMEGNINVAKQLLDKGANIHIQDNSENTAYSYLFAYIINHAYSKDMRAYKETLKRLTKTPSLGVDVKLAYQSFKKIFSR